MHDCDASCLIQQSFKSFSTHYIFCFFSILNTFHGKGRRKRRKGMRSSPCLSPFQIKETCQGLIYKKFQIKAKFTLATLVSSPKVKILSFIWAMPYTISQYQISPRHISFLSKILRPLITTRAVRHDPGGQLTLQCFS